jgi:hypothetical protein
MTSAKSRQEAIDTLIMASLPFINAIRLSEYVTRHLSAPQNRYQIAVGAKLTASDIVSVLEALVDDDLLAATGDKDNPNVRLYCMLT